MEKATHFGTCQVCGHLQKAPGNKMAKHGYTVQWSFFEGVCWGADHPPFELDKELAQKAHDSQQKSIDRHAELIEELKSGEINFDKVWKHDYIADARTGKYNYEWIVVEVKIERVEMESSNNFYFKAQYRTKPDAKWQRWDNYSYNAKTEIEYARELQEPRIKMHENYIRQLNSYRDWQAKRIAEWRVMPMKPVADEADKLTHIIEVFGKGFVQWTEARGWRAVAGFTDDRTKAKRMTEKWAVTMTGKLRGTVREQMKVVPA